jgi:NTE family protein
MNTSTTSHRHPSPPSIGLVLGGGGASGLAFHAGALLALQHDFGWDPNSARVVVGTSAGSIIALLLRSGVAVEDMAAWASGAEPTRGGGRFRSVMNEAQATPVRRRIPKPTLPGWNVFGAALRPRQIPAALLTALPHGVSDHSDRFAGLDDLIPQWPSEALWITATRVGDGRLQIFGTDLPEGHAGAARQAAPARAVAASCAIPLLAKPVAIGRHRYLDGGAHSATNAECLMSRRDLDTVIILSPMGQAVDEPRLFRHAVQHRLDNEVRRLEEAGFHVQTITPDASTADVMGWNLMDPDRVPAVMRSTFTSVTPQLDDATRERLRSAAAA